MTILILIYSLKSLYNHNIDTIVVPSLISQSDCNVLGNKISQDLKKTKL